MLRKGLCALALLAGGSALAQEAPPPVGIAPVMLDRPSYIFDTAEQHSLKIGVLVKGLARSFAIDFLPNGDLLVQERGGELRLLRNATGTAPVLDAAPITGMPRSGDAAFFLGTQDIAVHPDFSTNHLVYFTFNEPAPASATSELPQGFFRLMRAQLNDGKLSDVKVLYRSRTANAAGGSRVVIAKDGKVWVSTGAPGGTAAQDLGNAFGKVLRFNADGTIPQDNPFVGRAGADPAIYSLGHRDQHGLVVHPTSGEVFAAEHGPNGGDEVNRIKAGANYGWPTYTYGRDYDGKELTELPTAPGFEKPLLVWSPSIAPFGLMFYQGDKFPAWKGNLFIGSARWGEINQTGGLMRIVFNPELGELRRERLLPQLHQRVADVVQGPDGLIYVLTGGPENAVLRLEPEAAAVSPAP